MTGRALVAWLTAPATRALTGEALVAGLAAELVAADLEPSRVATSFPMLHPEVYVHRVIWTPEHGARFDQRDHITTSMPEYLDSPVALIHRGASAIRCRLTGPDADLSYPICHDLRAEGATDYICLPVELSRGRRTYLGMATHRAGGFSDAGLTLLDDVLPHLALLLELKSAEVATRGLLEVYLGKNAAERVLAGEVKRGAGTTIHAAIWTCDLRGFTAMSDSQPGAEVVATLDRYFERVAGPIADHGGEILKFIGDAVLAIFPVGGDPHGACRRALAAAESALANIEEFNQTRSAPLGLGLALHLGEVFYGNIGARERLDFTVIGAAVNEVCRMEPLCKELGTPLVVSAELVAALPEVRFASLGAHALRGVHSPAELFTLPRYEH